MLRIPMIVVPDPDDPGCADILVDAEIDGRPYRCHLDTGAGRTTLVSDDYLAGLAPCGQDTSAAAFSAATNDLVTIPGLTIGQLSAGPMDVVRLEPAPSRASLVGMDVLGRHCCRWFDAGILELTSSPEPAADLPLQVDNRGHMAGPLIGGVQFAPSLVAVFDMTPVNHGLQYPMDIVVGYPTYGQADWLFDVPARRWAAPELLAGR